MMNEKKINDFFKNVIIEETEKEKAKKSLFSKGITKHNIVKEKLLLWTDKETIEYSEIASTYRYDKRIRLVLFKFISYLEEFYRSYILDNFSYNYNFLSQFKLLSQALIKASNNLNSALEEIEFSTLLNIIFAMNEKDKKILGLPLDNHLKSNINALRAFRNAVMHNKFLLLYRGYEKCFVKGVDGGKSASLKANILNLIQFLPKEVGQKCKLEINNCSQDRNDDSDIKWNLPSVVLIQIA